MNLPRLFVIGDSISMQYGPHLEQYLDGLFDYDRKGRQETETIDPDLMGPANGGSSDMVVEYLKLRKNHGGLKADVLLLNCGLWDIRFWPDTDKLDVPIERYKDNLKLILDLAGRLDIGRVVWVRTTPVDDETHNSKTDRFRRHAKDLAVYNDAADAIMAAAGVASIDLHGFTSRLDEPHFCDHVHFTEPVRRLQAAHIAGHLLAWRAQGAHSVPA